MIYFHDAIYALNPSVVTIRDDVAYDKDDNIVEYDFATVEAKFKEMKAAEENAVSVKQASYESAISKLKKLGLTDDEISALKGTL